MRDFHRLSVWEKSHQLVLALYAETQKMPESERFGLTSQMRRAAVSIPSNIAEGYGRSSDKDFSRFLYIASGSCCELEYQLLLAADLGYMPQNQSQVLQGLCREVRQMIAGLLNKLAASN